MENKATSGAMQRQSSWNPNEPREYAEEDLPTERLINSDLSDRSSSEFMQHSGYTFVKMQK